MKRKRIGVCREDMLALVTGKARLNLPDDAEVERVMDNEYCEMSDIFMSSSTFPEINIGEIIPMECPSPERLIPVMINYAYSLTELVKYFKKMIKAGDLSTDDYRSTDLTTEYCDELIGVLSG